MGLQREEVVSATTPFSLYQCIDPSINTSLCSDIVPPVHGAPTRKEREQSQWPGGSEKCWECCDRQLEREVADKSEEAAKFRRLLQEAQEDLAQDEVIFAEKVGMRFSTSPS
jgi:hypothetical protein